MHACSARVANTRASAHQKQANSEVSFETSCEYTVNEMPGLTDLYRVLRCLTDRPAVCQVDSGFISVSSAQCSFADPDKKTRLRHTYRAIKHRTNRRFSGEQRVGFMRTDHNYCLRKRRREKVAIRKRC